MGKSLCHLLMKVTHVIVTNFHVANMSFNAISENKIIAKISKITVLWMMGHQFKELKIAFLIRSFKLGQF